MGVPVSIIFDRDPRFTSRLWKKLHEALGSRLEFSTAFHPQTDGQSERVIYILEDVLRNYVIYFRGSWEEYLPLAEQKTYADLKSRGSKYFVGDIVFLRVLPWKKVLRFGCKDKLSPQFLKLVRPVAYQLEIPSELDHIHDVFYVSMLRCYRSDPMHDVSVEEIEVRQNLTFEEDPVRILECDVKFLRKKSIPLVKVLWHNHITKEATWELEDAMHQQYPYLF
ncbi:uncharacterized protein LOC128039907 [Gossypium raimondii]|uniref:uncharacterized protein LOC128039907 n=1 Tax=Gossypium raimondii TaxID=29730 RepID=UPI00227CCC17|nr:uncharacterized protein LOC128039907 [Gossypium raimondii]